ncbi:hypothetical protein K439DRAFT_201302 [Ramaria rubella]|nr:hypothetical protein K439DRAFT_201302 [Ramaria rubella]
MTRVFVETCQSFSCSVMYDVPLQRWWHLLLHNLAFSCIAARLPARLGNILESVHKDQTQGAIPILSTSYSTGTGWNSKSQYAVFPQKTIYMSETL